MPATAVKTSKLRLTITARRERPETMRSHPSPASPASPSEVIVNSLLG